MKKLGRYIVVFLLCCLPYWALAQEPVVFQDDPVAAMLDSLAHQKYLSKAVTKPAYPKHNKYKFAPDSIPTYDDFIYEARLAKLDINSPFDLQYNSAVKAYIEMYTLRKRELVERMMGISQLYFPMFEEVFDRYQIPLELKYLAIVESALNPVAKSRAGAVGLWQFMYGTGKMYDLKVNSYVDERCDPYKATIAAAEYLKFLYEMFGDWQMVLASYNAGPGNILKAIRRSGGKKTYWEVRPYMPRETQGYVPAFIAATYVMNHTAEHNLYAVTPVKTYFQVDTVNVKQQLSFQQISSVLNIPVEDLQFLNPSFRKGIIPYNPSNPNYLCLPVAQVGNFVANEQKIYDYLKNNAANSQDILAIQEVQKTHIVKKGERINNVANRYKCSVADIKMWNNLRSLHLRTGQKLIVYVPAKVAAPASTVVANKEADKKSGESNGAASDALVTKADADKKENSAKGEYKYYTIQRGDTLWTISKKTGTSIADLRRLNNMGKKYVLLPGKQLKVVNAG